MIRLQFFPDGAVFDHGEIDAAGSRALDALLEQRARGRLASAKYLSTLRGIVAAHPLYIDGHAHLGAALFEQGKPKLALAASREGFELGKATIPSGYDGIIPWGFLQNRPFLRAAQGTAMCLARLGTHGEAIRIMEAMLRWNPSDNQGMRFMLGSSQLRAGEINAARQTFLSQADSYPPYHYERGLLEFAEGNVVPAATSLRRGLAENGYIAEILAGNPDPMPLPVWYRSNYDGPTLAREYAAMAEPQWHRVTDALAFLRWLQSEPDVLHEQAEFLSLRKQLAWENDSHTRTHLLNEFDAALEAIDDDLSAHNVKPRLHPRYGLISPWKLPV